VRNRNRTIGVVDVRRVADPSAFLVAADPVLLGDEARHNLMLGIAGTLRDQPGVYPEFHLLLVEDEGRVVGAALQTPPYNLVLARPSSPGAIAALADALHAQGPDVPGVTGAVPEVDDFAAAWEARTGLVRKRRMSQRIYRLAELRAIQSVGGRARPATVADRALLVAWIRAFVAEAVPADSPTQNEELVVDARLREGTGGFMLWEDGEPVALAGWGGKTPSGVRIGPVYTPPEWRRRGYGRAVTAAVSAQQLTSGRRFCFLYTDLVNATSNQIYMDIGYEPVCDSIDYAFAKHSGS
jgi:uncharacterized protein